MTSTSRNLSLDVLRGITIALMILVNTPGNPAATYGFLLHAGWHGFTPTDWVFPTFLFVMGASMSFVLPKLQSQSEKVFLRKVFVRAAIIFAIGYIMFWFPFVKYNAEGTLVAKPFETTRFLGVLQRIAIVYFITSLLVRYLNWKSCMLVSILILVGYRFMLSIFGDLTLEGNAVRMLDLLILGDPHMFHGEGLAFDPEGLLSTLPAVVNVMAGYGAGILIQRKGNSYETISHMLVTGCIFVFLGLGWDLFFPINKKLWTSSFVVYTIGLDLLVLGVLIYFIDIQRIRRWSRPFEVMGKNPLFLYVLSQVVVILLMFFRIDNQRLYNWLYEKYFQPLGEYEGSFAFALVALAFIWAIGYFLDRKRIYIKI